MIRITRINNADKSYDEVWAIVRSLKSRSDWIKQVTDLSPSPELFSTYRTLVNTNSWDINSYRNLYVSRFILDLQTNPTAREKLAYLYDQDRLGKKICLVCFCPDEEMCHRSIIGGILQGSGCNVVMDTDRDYSHYFKMYMGDDYCRCFTP